MRQQFCIFIFLFSTGLIIVSLPKKVGLFAQSKEVSKMGVSEGSPNLSRNERLRSQFLALVEEMDDIEKRKEDLIRRYIGLSEVNDELKRLNDASRSRLSKVDSYSYQSDVLNSEIFANERVAGWIKDKTFFMAKEYNLLKEKEKIDASLQNNKLSTSEYKHSIKFLEEDMARLNQIQTLKDITNGIRESLGRIELGLINLRWR